MTVSGARACRVMATLIGVASTLAGPSAWAQDPEPIQVSPDSISFELSAVEVIGSIAPGAGPSVGSGIPA